MAELALLKREDLEKVFEPLEKIGHKDFELGSDAIFHLSVQEVGGVPNVPVLVLNRQELPMTSDALAEMAKAVGIPEGYANRCPKDMLFPHLEHWYKGGVQGKVRFFTKEGKIIGCAPSTSSYHTNSEMLEQVEKAVGKEHILGYYQPYSSLDHSLYAVVVDKNFEVSTGDMLFGGIEIQNSILGERSVEIAPFIFRQICVNGAIVSENIGRWSRKSEDSNFASWVQGASVSSLQKIDGEFQRIKRLTEVPIGENPENTLRSLFLKFGIPVRTQREIIGEAVSMNNGEGPKNMYDLWNSLTYVASHSDKVSISSARDLRCVAGDFVHEINVCSHCGSLYEKKGN